MHKICFFFMQNTNFQYVHVYCFLFAQTKHLSNEPANEVFHGNFILIPINLHFYKINKIVRPTVIAEIASTTIVYTGVAIQVSTIDRNLFMLLIYTKHLHFMMYFITVQDVIYVRIHTTLHNKPI